MCMCVCVIEMLEVSDQGQPVLMPFEHLPVLRAVDKRERERESAPLV